MTWGIPNFCRLMCLSVALAGASVASAQTPASTPTAEVPRFLVYFDELSANLSDDAKATIADAAKRARDTGATNLVVQAPVERRRTNISHRHVARSSRISSKRTALRGR